MGALLSIHIKSGRKLSFISNGNKVPDDLKMLNNVNISEIILGEKNDKNTRNRLSSWMRNFSIIKK